MWPYGVTKPQCVNASLSALKATRLGLLLCHSAVSELSYWHKGQQDNVKVLLYGLPPEVPAEPNKSSHKLSFATWAESLTAPRSTRRAQQIIPQILLR